MKKELTPRFVMTVKCTDKKGIVAETSGRISELNGFIHEAAHHYDSDSGQAFMRFSFDMDGEHGGSAKLVRKAFKPVADKFDMNITIHDTTVKIKILIATSKHGHCLNDLLHRWKTGILPADICGVASNHDDMRSMVEWYNLPYYYLPVNKENKALQEAQIIDLFEEHRADLLILARYMQILSNDTCQFFNGRAINIHHSFLPSFKGAQPYRQAHSRGVKIIGATAHYITADLDEGPIIEQSVERVSHSSSAQDLMNIGRDIEALVLARAVRWHAQHRVIQNGNKTVVFN